MMQSQCLMLSLCAPGDVAGVHKNDSSHVGWFVSTNVIEICADCAMKLGSFRTGAVR